MWDDVAALNRSAKMFYGVAAALLLYGLGHHLLHLSAFPLREISLTGDIGHVTHEQVEDIVSRELRGNFFTVDLERARAAFEKLPWVRKVNLRRHWPDRLEVAVEEHRPIARWGSVALVSAHGEVFEAAINSALPVLNGPHGSAPEVVARLIEFERILEPIDKQVVQVTLSMRRAWRVRLDDGMVLELGRENLEARLVGFVAAYPVALARLAHQPAYVDLRYSNGFAVRSPGLKWTAAKA